MLLLDELEALVEPEGTGFARDALRRPVGVEHAESRAAGALSCAGGSEERDAPRARDCKSLIHSFSSWNLSVACRSVRNPGTRNKRAASAVRYRAVGIRRKKAGRAEARRGQARRKAAARRKAPGPARRRVSGRGGRVQRPKSLRRARH